MWGVWFMVFFVVVVFSGLVFCFWWYWDGVGVIVVVLCFLFVLGCFLVCGLVMWVCFVVVSVFSGWLFILLLFGFWCVWCCVCDLVLYGLCWCWVL
jgi:hypothetical protein